MAAKIKVEDLLQALDKVKPWITQNETEPELIQIEKAVKISAKYVEQIAIGRSVEVRIPPYIAFQCVEGPKHTRGVPSNVVEMDPYTWLGLVLGVKNFEDELNNGKIDASGIRSADLKKYLPLT